RALPLPVCLATGRTPVAHRAADAQARKIILEDSVFCISCSLSVSRATHRLTALLSRPSVNQPGRGQALPTNNMDLVQKNSSLQPPYAIATPALPPSGRTPRQRRRMPVCPTPPISSGRPNTCPGAQCLHALPAGPGPASGFAAAQQVASKQWPAHKDQWTTTTTPPQADSPPGVPATSR